MRDDQRNYIVVGVFVIAMVAGLVLWIAKVSNRTGPMDAYYIRFGAVPGLAVDSAVYFDGYPVGRIKSIDPVDDDDGRRFWLDVSIQEGWEIPEDSKAKIVAGFLSAVFVNVEGGDSESSLAPGDQIPSVEAVDLFAAMTETMEFLKPKIDTIVSDLSHTMDQVNTLLSSENAGRFAKILENLEAVSAEAKAVASGLGGSQERLDGLLANVDGVVANVDRALDQVNELIAENEDEISQSVVDLHESLEALARHADAIASNLEVMTRNMNEFSQQIREDPGVILRGRSAADEPTGAK
jgi:phospholipid/cholesterol/gamma-HCH transport system substrate-binding protein